MASTENSEAEEVEPHAQLRSSHPQGLRSEPSINTVMNFLPAAIWQTGWTQPETMAPTYSITQLASTVYNAEFPDLVIEGSSVPALRAAYDAILTTAVKSNDFSRLLAAKREFNLNNNRLNLFSTGPGIEREVIFTAFAEYRLQSSQWFLPLCDNFATLQTSARFFLSRFITPDRLERVKKLGALCALLLINGQCPEPFNPLIFQYMINNSDLNSLHETLVGEWHSDLRMTIRQWIEIGENGDVTPFQSHFASFHNQCIVVLRHRNMEMHNRIGAEMLYSAVLGPEPPSHPEWIAFREGFSLPCSNGFNFCMIPKQFEGGPESFFSMLWTSKITGYESIGDHLQFLRPPNGFIRDLAAATGQITISVDGLVTNFLKGTGIPCQELFDSVKGGFSSLIDLSQIDDASFRLKTLVWASTGCPHLDLASDPIVIGMVLDTDHLYASNRQQAAYMAEQGKISFRTCLKAARLPASYVQSLATANYPSISSSEPQSFQQAFDHWMLCEILSAIGGISML